MAAVTHAMSFVAARRRGRAVLPESWARCPVADGGIHLASAAAAGST